MAVYESDMRSEFKRYATFSGFRSNEVWPLQLAQAGFFRSGSCLDNQVVCFACGLVLDARTLNRESVKQVHHRLAPTCSFVSGSSNNQPVPSFDPAASVEWLRQNFPIDTLQQDTDMVDSGQNLPQLQESFSGRGNNIARSLPVFTNDFPMDRMEPTSHSILTDLNTLEQSGDPASLPSLPFDLIDILESTNLDEPSPTAAHLFALGENSLMSMPTVSDGNELEGNIASEIIMYNSLPQHSVEVDGLVKANPGVVQKISFDDLGIIVQRPKNEEYSTVHQRLQTFARYRGPHISQTVEAITEAGFYYAGYSDCCRCFHCGGGVKNWDPEDDPWVEHARWFKNCPFVHSNKGKAFINAVQTLAQTSDKIRMNDVMKLMASGEKNDENKGLPNEVEMDTEMDETEPDNGSIQLENEAMRLTDENDSLKQPNICKICLDNEVSILYIPCGHLVTCGSCGSTIKRCPLCRQAIHGLVRIQRSN